MLYSVVGIGSRMSGTSKTSGKPYDFTIYFCLCSVAGVQGHKAEEVSFSHLSQMIQPDIQVGDTINVDYDRRGFMVGISLVEKSKGTTKININASS